MSPSPGSRAAGTHQDQGGRHRDPPRRSQLERRRRLPGRAPGAAAWVCARMRHSATARKSGRLVPPRVSFPFLATLILDHRGDVPDAYLERERVTRSVRWPRAERAVSRPSGMVSNQPSRTARLPAGPSTRSRRGLLPSHPAVPSMTRAIRPCRLSRARISPGSSATGSSVLGHQPPSRRVGPGWSGCKSSRGPPRAAGLITSSGPATRGTSSGLTGESADKSRLAAVTSFSLAPGPAMGLAPREEHRSVNTIHFISEIQPARYREHFADLYFVCA